MSPDKLRKAANNTTSGQQVEPSEPININWENEREWSEYLTAEYLRESYSTEWSRLDLIKTSLSIQLQILKDSPYLLHATTTVSIQIS